MGKVCIHSGMHACAAEQQTIATPREGALPYRRWLCLNDGANSLWVMMNGEEMVARGYGETSFHSTKTAGFGKWSSNFFKPAHKTFPPDRDPTPSPQPDGMGPIIIIWWGKISLRQWVPVCHEPLHNLEGAHYRGSFKVMSSFPVCVCVCVVWLCRCYTDEASVLGNGLPSPALSKTLGVGGASKSSGNLCQLRFIMVAQFWMLLFRPW